MEGIILIIVAFVFTATGKVFDEQFQEKYSESALNMVMCVIQGIFIACALLTLPNPSVTVWFILWCAGVIISCIVGVSLCKQRAISLGAESRDIKKIMVAQFILPIGAVLLFIIILMIIFGKEKKKRKKRK